MVNVQEFFDKIKDINDKNAGGCLFFCYLFFCWLRKNNYPTDSFEIVQIALPYEEDRIQQNIEFINKQRDSAVSSAHFAWRYNNEEYDSDGVLNHVRWDSYPKATLPLFGDTEAIISLCENALMNGRWNTWFKRNAAIQIISERFGIDFSHLGLK